MTEQQFVDFITGVFFNLQIANYDAGLTIAQNVVNAFSETDNS